MAPQGECAHTKDNNRQVTVDVLGSSLPFTLALIAILIATIVNLDVDDPSYTPFLLYYSGYAVFLGVHLIGCLLGLFGAILSNSRLLLLFVVAEGVTLGGYIIINIAQVVLLRSSWLVVCQTISNWLAGVFVPFIMSGAVAMAYQTRLQLMHFPDSAYVERSCTHTKDNNKLALTIILSLVLLLSFGITLFNNITNGLPGAIVSCPFAILVVATIVGIVAIVVNGTPQKKANLLSVFLILAVLTQIGFVAASLTTSFLFYGALSSLTVSDILLLVFEAVQIIVVLLGGAAAIFAGQSRVHLNSGTNYVPLNSPGSGNFPYHASDELQ
eukprot:TRINITY_DN13220_c0_g1_i1.p1 TRINITY_DN13220_c0_g1~~TRINITY_DN13220_c0_g1_i1.p1  ORF type:complete len:327 (-),score=25.28 TRINITY_DN13220_c0_g1_i1:93-1073(-)